MFKYDYNSIKKAKECQGPHCHLSRPLIEEQTNQEH